MDPNHASRAGKLDRPTPAARIVAATPSLGKGRIKYDWWDSPLVGVRTIE